MPPVRPVKRRLVPRRLVTRRLACVALVGLGLAAVAPACTQGQGTGSITGSLNVPNCWTGQFDLAPDFFAAVPYKQTLDLRFQNGSDFETFSDGLAILLDDITQIRGDANASPPVPDKYKQPLKVDLPASVTPPGVPLQANADPGMVHMTMYLNKTCATENVTLDVVDTVTIPTDGTCDAPDLAGADPNAACDPATVNPKGLGSGKSLVAFTSVFNGRIDEPTASQRLTAGCFDVYLADPRDVQPGGGGPPPKCQGHLKGTFSFFFERGRPAQPFP